MHKEKRGLRFQFSAEAEVRSEGSQQSVPARVTELSLRGCFLETSGSFADHERVRVKIFNADDCIETLADVIYTRANGVGILFADTTQHVRGVLQNWVLTALDHHAEEVSVS
jgi:hypothetical protein